MENKLLVEGKDDEIVFNKFIEKENFEKEIKIVNQGGESLYKNIPLYLKTDSQAIGIIVDADNDSNAKWDKIKYQLQKSNYKLPKFLNSEGTIIKDENLPTIGVWVMPNNNENGMLEDFIKYLIPNDDKLINVVNDTLDNIESKKLNNYSLAHRPKARIHTWLAWQKEPGTQMGAAINKRYLDTNKDLCVTFIEWLHRLFN